MLCRMKTNQKENILFIPVDVTVTATPGLYVSEDTLDLGYGFSMQDPSLFLLEVFNSARRAIKINVSASASLALCFLICLTELSCLLYISLCRQ